MVLALVSDHLDSTFSVVAYGRFDCSRILLKRDRDTELARAVDVMMARAKRIYILMIKVSCFLFSVAEFPEYRNIFMFVSRFRINVIAF